MRRQNVEMVVYGQVELVTAYILIQDQHAKILHAASHRVIFYKKLL